MLSQALRAPRPTLGQRLFRIYWWLEGRITPGLRSSQYVFAERLADLLNRADRPAWLDVGCGRRPFPDWMPDQARRVVSAARHPVGIDLDLDSLRDHDAYRDKVLAPAEALPFADGTFDVVSANMVVEHVTDPARLLAEVRRVLKHGGAFAFHTSNRFHWPVWLAARIPERLKLALTAYLEDRRAADVFPTHYQINDESRLRALAAEAGLQVERLELLSTSAVSAKLGPVVVLELLWIRLVRQKRLAWLRSNLIVVLRKPGVLAGRESG